MYEELRQYKCCEGHCNIPQQYSKNNWKILDECFQYTLFTFLQKLQCPKLLCPIIWDIFLSIGVNGFILIHEVSVFPCIPCLLVVQIVRIAVQSSKRTFSLEIQKNTRTLNQNFAK